MAAGRDGGERYPTSAEEYTTPAERWSNSATRHRTSREDSSTQQTTERIESKKMDVLLYRKVMTPPTLCMVVVGEQRKAAGRGGG